MNIYRMSNNVTHYQYLLSSKKMDSLKLLSDCKPRLSQWVPPEVFIYEPLLKRGSLYNFGGSMPIFSSEAMALLNENFGIEMAGELLPLPSEEGEMYWALNVLECINCLNQEKTIWKDPSKHYLGITNYVFHADRLSRPIIFKIPETYRNEVYIRDPDGYDGRLGELFENLGLEGIQLDLLDTL